MIQGHNVYGSTCLEFACFRNDSSIDSYLA
ncbi:hypothetical protein [Photobacterium leiognathi]